LCQLPLGNSMGTHWELDGNTLWTQWEHIGNTLGTEKKKSLPHHLPAPQLGLIIIPPLSINCGVLINWSARREGVIFFLFLFWAFSKALVHGKYFYRSKPVLKFSFKGLSVIQSRVYNKGGRAGGLHFFCRLCGWVSCFARLTHSGTTICAEIVKLVPGAQASKVFPDKRWKSLWSVQAVGWGFFKKQKKKRLDRVSRIRTSKHKRPKKETRTELNPI
jgi:hypothetical protein